ncbi:VOC family protein [Herbaspirillum sp. DW155]|uniref:VOC family protein n=1 Tax=Herbaspirillum sp. DW155 TaxID=3095609 RepID=UPI003087870C|nr:VOC family protein [Herbaspirillum sp. DW155]
MAQTQFGIDHPVVTVRDFEHVRKQFQKLGFAPTPVGYHPWGTTLSLLMFVDNFIEIIAVHDASKFGTNAVNGFCYGSNVGNFTDRVEGLGLVALHSKDGKGDHQLLMERGLKSQGQIDFVRNMKKPDGTPDVAVVSLGLFMNEEQRDVSNFICHQHRPELIWIPEWQKHPNEVNAVTAVTYVAPEPKLLARRYEQFYGKSAVTVSDGLVVADTGCGLIRIATKDVAKALLGEVDFPKWDDEDQAHGISISVSTPQFANLENIWQENGVRFQKSPSGSYVISPDQCGNVIMEFQRA